MGCQAYFPNPQLSCRLPKYIPNYYLSPLPRLHRPLKTCRLFHPISSTTTATESPVPTADDVVYDVEFRTLGACKLGISRYPDFEYNAEGGRGSGKGIKNGEDDEISVDFELKSVYIPPLTTATTKFLGLPLPPLLKIDIVPELFTGTINQESGKIDLEFRAKFWFSIGSVYRAPPLVVETVLTSEESKGKMKKGRGERLKNNNCRLVGVATVQPIDDVFLNSFLSLPSECLADLNASISLSPT
ncbi:PREDICTED: uncharacterized protein LOC109151087 [Ipomoea nil]|uniref:uncharacterized protein LOC109151087 n=1 Tax=Ipomoea nil TaxID=35883 RepID=UPI0009017477|nr:PREDICTED: uncharacterized protein LOC109151087 [Ipomoea nil]